MSGDVNALDGTTRLLVEQANRVIDAVRDGDAPVALLGHSMATDILVRTADDTPGVGPVVLLSAFSRAIDSTHPETLLLVTGAWEPGLRDFALEAAQMVDPGATFGETVRDGDVTRRALLAPAADHVSILHSRAGRSAALDWLNTAYGRDATAPVPRTGWALLALMAAITALAVPLSRLLPARDPTADAPAPMAARTFAAATLLPAIAAPLLAAPLDTRALPVLVADYLVVHLAIYGLVQLGVLWRAGRRLTPLSAPATIGLVLYALVVFGVALDRYGANFWPSPRAALDHRGAGAGRGAVHARR